LSDLKFTNDDALTLTLFMWTDRVCGNALLKSLKELYPTRWPEREV